MCSSDLAPKARLKEIQRWVLHEILDQVPVHAGAHGFQRGRSVINAARDGAPAHNRAGVADFEAHVRGRIAWVSALHPGRGEKLLRMFERVDWRA